MDPVELLLDLLVKDGRWPPRREARVQEEIRTHRAFLESDRDSLRMIAGWDSTDREYKVDPLGALIADTWASHLYGEDLTIKPAADSDQKPMEALLDANGDLGGLLYEAERIVVGEGETWRRCYIDRDVADYPLVDYHSRDVVIPLWIGRRLAACALVTELPQIGRSKAKYRHLEINADGLVEHVLFRGTQSRIGETVALERHPDLVDLAAGLTGNPDSTDARRWEHGLPNLMARIGNGRGLDRRLKIGVSDFKRIVDFLLDLNEAATIGAENARLTAKKRVVVSEDALRVEAPELVDNGDGTLSPVRAAGRAQFDAGEDVLVTTRLDQELGKDPSSTFKVLEYSFDAEALIAYKRDLVETALTRIGLTPRYVGAQTGEAPGVLSGTAYRLTLIPTIKAGRGKARPWDDENPQTIALLAMLDNLAETEGGFGRPWTDPTTPPSVTRPTALPQDETEDAQVEATLVNARLRSRFTSIKAQHPDWNDDQVNAELKLIDDDQPPPPAGLSFGA